MGQHTVLRGDVGVDFSGADLTGKQLSAAGAKFALRYSAGAGNTDSGTKWKLCGAHEIADITLAGLDFIANSEWYETRITEGAKAGAADGAADLLFWKGCGLARGASIYISWDKAPDKALFDAVDDYLAAYYHAQGGYYDLPSLYAGDAAIHEMRKRSRIRYGWQTMSTSWSDDGLPYQPSHQQIQAVLLNPPAGVDIWQNGNYWFPGKLADENIALNNNLGSHNASLYSTSQHPVGNPPTANPPKPIVKPAPKPVPASGSYTIRPSDSDGLIAVCARHGISNWKAVAALNHIAAPDYVIHSGDVIRFPQAGVVVKPVAVAKAVHEVIDGDTITSIARKWGVDPKLVEKANPRAGHPAGNFDLIKPGDKITHP